MALLSKYLSERKQKRLMDLLNQHVGRCKAVGHTLSKIADHWSSGDKEAAKMQKEIIETEEKSADHLEQKLITQVSKSSIPSDNVKDDLISFVRLLDTSAGGAKRAGLNMLLLLDYPLPEKYAEIVEDACNIISDIIAKIEKAIGSLDDVEAIKSINQEIDNLENKMDDHYRKLKEGYFVLEEAFNSAAAILILDHVTRDLEHSADTGEDAIDLLLELVQRRS